MVMKQLKLKLVLTLLLIGTSYMAQAFSLLGPFKAYQQVPIGYNLTGDIGGPMAPFEAYRWNVPILTYAFDDSFIKYFGPEGVKAIEKAFAILNDLPPAAQITNDGANLYVRGEIVPTETKLLNHQAAALSLLDIKTSALEVLLEELGLAEPERWSWALRARTVETIGGVQFTNYTVIQQNFDWLTLRPTNQVNSAFYGFDLLEFQNPDYADAVERVIAPLPSTGLAFSSIASSLAFPGEFAFGLTRDDIAGLRYLYSANNVTVEDLLATVTIDTGRRGRSPWGPFPGITNVTGTNIIGNATNQAGLVVRAGRPGVEKIRFERIPYDSLTGQIPSGSFTNRYTDLVVTNRIVNDEFVSELVAQQVQRVMTQPDFLFMVQDLGLIDNLIPALRARTATTAWINNDAINGSSTLGGPGVIVPQIQISFTDKLPYFVGQTPSFLDETTVTGGFVWGSFDETDAPPIVYPRFGDFNLEVLQEIILGGTGN
jgi:hypothetical protein